MVADKHVFRQVVRICICLVVNVALTPVWSVTPCCLLTRGGVENTLRNTLIFTATETKQVLTFITSWCGHQTCWCGTSFVLVYVAWQGRKKKEKKELPTWYVQRCLVPLQWSNKSSQCHSSCLFVCLFFIISYADNFTVPLLETAGRYWIKLNPTIPHCQKIIGFLTHLNSLSHPECAEVHMRAQAPPTHGVISSFCPRDFFFTAWAGGREGKGELRRAKGKTKLPPPSK